jgi:hypothetical protein
LTFFGKALDDLTRAQYAKLREFVAMESLEPTPRLF